MLLRERVNERGSKRDDRNFLVFRSYFALIHCDRQQYSHILYELVTVQEYFFTH